MPVRLSFIRFSAPIRRPVSSRRRTAMCEFRSPLATVSATFTASSMPPVIETIRRHATTDAIATASALTMALTQITWA